MKNKSNVARNLGGLVIIVIQAIYWIYLAASPNVKTLVDLIFRIFILPTLLCLIYCLFENKVIFPCISTNAEETWLAVLWTGITILGVFVVSNVIHERNIDMEFFEDFYTALAFLGGGVFGFAFFIIRSLLKNTSNC